MFRSPVATSRNAGSTPGGVKGLDYSELHAHSGFSLLDGASTPEALCDRAAALGYQGLALTDHDELGGIVRHLQATTDKGLHGIAGAEITLEDDTHLTVLVETAQGWANLSRLLTRARMEGVPPAAGDDDVGSPGACVGPPGAWAERGMPRTALATLLEHSDGLLVFSGCLRGRIPRLLLRDQVAEALRLGGRLRETLGDRFALEVMDHDTPEEQRLVPQLVALARHLGAPWVVTGNVHYATPAGREVHDVLTCLRYRVLLDEAGTRLRPNGRWALWPLPALAARWDRTPWGREGLQQSIALAERCQFRLADIRPRLPDYPLPPGVSPDSYLRELVRTGFRERYPRPTTRHRRQVRHELEVIRRLGLAGYFLVVWDIVRFCRREGILCQGRGSAANSAVCYCLGITAVDPIGMDLLFERFLSEARDEPPDIDLDIAHRDRERVLQYVYERYGRDHAAMVSETITYRARSAVRDAARVLGFSPAQGDALARQMDRHQEAAEAAAILAQGDACIAAGLDPAAPRVQALCRVVRGMDGLPRHRSIHVGGFVMTSQPLSEVTPVEPASMPGRTVIPWDKDDLAPVGLIKIDLLGLGMLTVLQDALALIARTCGEVLDLARLPMDDPGVYDLLCAADTVGVFQVESRAQMNTLPRLRPRRFYDLVVEVALIRPGPIQGEMVHPYLRRRRGEEPVTYLHPSLKPVLARTLGVPLFQEQGMKCAIACAGFSPEQADELRRAMGFRRATARMARIGEQLVAGMRRNGLDANTIHRIVHQLTAFAHYGFPESHAASFALLVYASAFLKRYYAPEFLACLLNAQPMGFYGPGTLVQDARRRGVLVLPPDLARSAWHTTIETTKRPFGPPAPRTHSAIRGPRRAVRLGLRLVRGLGATARHRLEAALAEGPFESMADVVTRSGLNEASLRTLAQAGAFESFLPDRRQALWEVLRLVRSRGAPLAPPPRDPHPAPGRPLHAAQKILFDYATMGASALGHPVAAFRQVLQRQGVVRAADLRALPPNRPLAVAGLVICRQRPGTAKGFFFLTLEDETGHVNVIVRPARFERHAQLLRTAPLLVVHGRLQHDQGVVNVLGDRFRPLGADPDRTPDPLGRLSHDFR